MKYYSNEEKLADEKITPFLECISASENTFKKILIDFLSQNRIGCDVYHNQLLPCFIEKDGKTVKRLKKKSIIGKYEIIKPDFLLIKYGLAIEIDGSVHNKEFKIKKDHFRDQLLQNHSLHVLHIDADKIDPSNRDSRRYINQLLKDLLIHVNVYKSFPEKKKAIRKIKKSIEKATQEFKELLLEPSITFDNKSQYRKDFFSTPKTHTYPTLKNIEAYTHVNGGYLYRLK